ncbi:MAG: cob(I)yrinic acid a,c-diamide adenosyltransferase [Chloroflexi bacterium]|nr:cob(I)yrinic acid a,c-diamide adenosyltransferase [Chloroflexota bacterium]
MKSYRKRKDEGETDLLYGGRIPKESARAEAYGTIDEAVSALGIARALAGGNEALQAILLGIQRELFLVGAELATDSTEYPKLVQHFGQVTSAMVDRLEQMVAEHEVGLEIPKAFVVPGGNLLAAHLDLARTIVRRAERRSAGLWHDRQLVNEQVLRYLNRLSDLLFVLARAEERGATTFASAKLEG